MEPALTRSLLLAQGPLAPNRLLRCSSDMADGIPCGLAPFYIEGLLIAGIRPYLKVFTKVVRRTPKSDPSFDGLGSVEQ